MVYLTRKELLDALHHRARRRKDSPENREQQEIERLQRTKVLLITERGRQMEALLEEQGIKSRNIYSSTAEWSVEAYERYRPDITFTDSHFSGYRNAKWDVMLGPLIKRYPEMQIFVMTREPFKEERKPEDQLLDFGSFVIAPFAALIKNPDTIQLGMLKMLRRVWAQEEHERMIRKIRSEQTRSGY